MNKRDLQRRRATAKHNRNAWGRRGRIRPLLFEADVIALAAAFGKSIAFPATDYAAVYRAAWAEALQADVRDPSETVSQAVRVFCAIAIRWGEAHIDTPLAIWWVRRCVRNVKRYNAARHSERRKVALEVAFPIGDKSYDAPEAERTVSMDWDALKRLSPMERKLAADYLRWLSSTSPATVHTLVSGGEEANMSVSISRFARDNTGLSTAVAWTHAKRVVQAFRDGLYTI